MSGTRSLRRTRTFRGKTTTNTARELKFTGRTPDGTANTLTAPSQEAFRRTIEAGICPWCHAGPFHIIATHTNRVHDVTAAELRELAGMFKHEQLTSAEYHERRQRIGRELYEQGRTGLDEHRAAGIRKPRQLSEAARELQRQKAANQTDESRARGARKNSAQRLAAVADRDAEILRLLATTELTVGEIGDHFGIMPRTVVEVARRNGVDAQAMKRRAIMQSSQPGYLAAAREAQAEKVAEARAAFVAEYHAGSTVYEMAERHGVTVGSVRARLRDLGVDLPDGRSDPDRPWRGRKDEPDRGHPAT